MVENRWENKGPLLTTASIAPLCRPTRHPLTGECSGRGNSIKVVSLPFEAALPRHTARSGIGPGPAGKSAPLVWKAHEPMPRSGKALLKEKFSADLVLLGAE